MNKKFDCFTLVELIIMITILGIIAAIAVPRIIEFKSKAEEAICVTNRKTVECIVIFYLKMNMGIAYLVNFFAQNFDEVCPAGGVISNEDGKVKCSVHEDGSESDEDESPGDEVPWL